MLMPGYMIPRSFCQRVEETIQTEKLGLILHRYWGIFANGVHFAVIISKDEAKNVGSCFNVRKIIEKKNGPLNISVEGFMTSEEASAHCTEMLMILKRQAKEESKSIIKLRSRTLERNEGGLLRSPGNFVRRSLRDMRDVFRRSSKTKSSIEPISSEKQEDSATPSIYPNLTDLVEKPATPQKKSIFLRNKKE